MSPHHMVNFGDGQTNILVGSVVELSEIHNESAVNLLGVSVSAFSRINKE